MTGPHRWDVSPSEAIAIQKELAARLVIGPVPTTPRWVAAADVSSDRGSDRISAAVVLCDLETHRVVESVAVTHKANFPYVPGLLSFREAPPILELFDRLERAPDLVLCDGQGIAHPRRMGIASHVGIWLDRPTVGCAKSRLYGAFEPPGPDRGSWSPLTAGDDTIGAVLRTRDRISPLFVSPGHRIDLPGSIAVVLAAGDGRRLPWPSRAAHEACNAERRRFK